MNEITLSKTEMGKFGQIMDYVHEQCSMHRWAVGVGEMAVGAAIIATGVQLGHIHIGSDVLGTELDGTSSESIGGGVLGAGTATVAAAILGSIGVVGGGGAVAIPAWLLISGGSAIFGTAGFGIGDAVHHFLHPPIDVGEFFAGVSLTNIGVALLIDGARRLISDEGLKQSLSDFRDGVVHLIGLTGRVIVDSFDALKRMIDALAPNGVPDAAGSAATGVAGAATGAAIGTSVAAGTVSVLGSHALGGLALSLGLISAPLWPVFAGGAAGLAIGYGTWRAVRLFGRTER
jgi:hypothetical protein